MLDLGRLHQRVLTVEDLHGAEEVALVSSLRGWRPAQLVARPSCGPGRPRVAVQTSRAGGS